MDCARILIKVYSAAGLIEDFVPEDYPPDWHLHRDEERYVETIEGYADEFDWAKEAIRPADVVVWRVGHTFSHGAIVTAWPVVVHAYAPARVVEQVSVIGSAMERMPNGEPRPMRAFRPRAPAP